MRINKYIAQSSKLSRRAADSAIEEHRVLVNGHIPSSGYQVQNGDVVKLDGIEIKPSNEKLTIMLNKPTGYICSRDGQGNRTVYDLLPAELYRLKPVGRLDKESSGLLIMTTDGDLANELTHPKFEKTKVYEISLLKPLQPLHRQMISDYGVKLDDGPSKLQLERIKDKDDTLWRITMSEGRNRQIRRTFESLGYTVHTLHRITFGAYGLGPLKEGKYQQL